MRAAPSHVGARKMLARLYTPGRPADAVAAILPAVEAAPQDVDALTSLAIALSALGRHDEATARFQAVVALTPLDAAAQSNLAVALVRSGDPHAAVRAAERAIELEPERAEAHANLGHALNMLSQGSPAVAAFEEALRLRPDFADALLGLARAYRELGRAGDAAATLRRAADAAPASVTALVDLGPLLRELGDVQGARLAFDQALQRAPAHASLHSNRLLEMQYDPTISEEEACRASCDWGLDLLRRTAPITPAPGPDRSADRILRLGYVSADFYQHPVGWLGAAAIVGHDRTAFHVTAYANHTSSDDLTERIRAGVDRWTPVLGLDDDDLARRIAEDRIDILVDLSGHTNGARLGVFARRAAPVQTSWLGYFATTGLPTMDFVVMDDDHLVEGAEALFVEDVIRLPRLRFCYSPPEVGPPAGATPGRPITFGSFNNPSKLNDAVFDLWSKVLTATPGSRLLLKWRSFADAALQQRVRDRFASRGVAPERLLFSGASPHADMLRQYGEVDIGLDPFPFSGGLTTCEALVMGTPVVTLPGRRPVSRQTLAILRAVCRPEWAAKTETEYVEIASRLATDRASLGALRQTLPVQVRGSALCDQETFIAALESAYREMWRRYLADAGTPSV